MEIKAIKAVRMFDHGFMNQSFAFGGEEGKEAFDEQIIYRSSLQNFLIDTGNEVILIDTGFKTGASVPAKKLGAPLYMGDRHSRNCPIHGAAPVANARKGILLQ